MRYLYLTVLICVLLLAGCGASQDPREGGFFGGISGLGSGAYEERVEEREQRLSRLQQIQKDLDAESREIDAQKTDLREQIELERAHLEEMQNSTARLEQEVSRMSAGDAAGEKKVNELRSRLNDLQSGLQKQEQELSSLDQLEGTYGHGDAGEEVDLRRRQLEEQRRYLQEEYELLLELALELSG